MVDPKEEATDAGGKQAEKKLDSSSKKTTPPWVKKTSAKPANKPQVPSTTSSGFKGGVKAIEDDIFIYGKGMTAKWLKSKDKLLAYIGSRFTMNEAKSLENGKISLIGLNPRDDIKTKADYDKLTFAKQKFYDIDIKKYGEAEASIKKNLSTCFSIIWHQMDRTLKNQVEKDPRYLKAYQELNAPLLYTIMSDICNSSSSVDHYESRYVEMLYNVLMCSGRSHTLAEYYELFNHRVRAAQAAGVDLRSADLRERLIDNATIRCGNDPTKVQDYIDNRLQGDLQEAQDKVFALIFMKRAGPEYEQCRKELNNDYIKGADNFPKTIDEAYTILQSYEALAAPQHKSQGNSVGDANHSSKSKTGLSFQQKGDFR